MAGGLALGGVVSVAIHLVQRRAGRRRRSAAAASADTPSEPLEDRAAA